jgi:hypothetical protein
MAKFLKLQITNYKIQITNKYTVKHCSTGSLGKLSEKEQEKRFAV